MHLPKQYHFNNVSLLITHYNRSQSLKRLLESFQQLGCSFDAIIVSDDGSQPEHLTRLQEWQTTYSFALLTTPSNKGLGNNINKGQDAVRTPFTLYVQEDFEAKSAFVTTFQKAMEIIQQNPTVDTIKFYAYFFYPYRKLYTDQFYELIFKPWAWNYFKYYQYSDHPHLRRSNFLQKFGRYPEGVNGDETEYHMCLSFLKHKGKAIVHHSLNEVFDQINTPVEPSTANFRHVWRTKKNIITRLVRAFYLQCKTIKYHVNYWRFKN
jgi:glycosyltransferase involved in cell wall biosynthesis